MGIVAFCDETKFFDIAGETLVKYIWAFSLGVKITEFLSATLTGAENWLRSTFPLIMP